MIYDEKLIDLINEDTITNIIFAVDFSENYKYRFSTSFVANILKEKLPRC